MKFLLLFSILTSTFNIFAQAERAAKRGVLLIGDSLSVGDFGDYIFDHMVDFVNRNEPVHGYASCGSHMGHWLNGTETGCGYRERHFDANPRINTSNINTQTHRTPLLRQLIRRHNPKYVVIELGGNAFSLSKTKLTARVDRFINIIEEQGAKCFWAGPSIMAIVPNPRKPRLGRVARRYIERLPGLYLDLSEAIANRCELYDSRPSTPPSLREHLGDGVHFGGSAAQFWADDFFEFIQSSGLQE